MSNDKENNDPIAELIDIAQSSIVEVKDLECVKAVSTGGMDDNQFCELWFDTEDEFVVVRATHGQLMNAVFDRVISKKEA